ncbi:MAG: hypothetical protein LRY63_11415 [Nitrincola sp.]|nr:hypothetical protein [Nitrincola sp.]
MLNSLRHFSRVTASLLILSLSSWSLADSENLSPEIPPSVHGIAMHGDLKYPADFTHFDYVNPNAPKGGRVVQSAIGSFDSFNPLLCVALQPMA